MTAIFKREFRSFFHGMLGYVLTAFLVASSGLYFLARCLIYGLTDFSYYTLYQALAIGGQLLQTACCRQMPFGKDQDLLADCLHLTEDMAGQDNCMCPAQLPDELADLDDLCRVQADRRLVQNDEPGAAQQCLCNAHPLLVALGKAADEPGQNGFQCGRRWSHSAGGSFGQ